MISIIIPTYNERGNVPLLVSALEKKIRFDHEIIFVDDNSPDGTADAINSLSKKYPCVRIVRRPGKDGLTSAVVAGFNSARGDILVVMDADLSHPPGTVPLLLSSIGGCDMVVGSRLMRGGSVSTWPFHRKLLSRGAEFLARFISPNILCTDPLSGFFAVRKEVFQRTKIRVNGYKILLNILVDNPGLKIAEVPYVFHNRHYGVTKLGSGEIVTYIFDILRLKFSK